MKAQNAALRMRSRGGARGGIGCFLALLFFTGSLSLVTALVTWQFWYPIVPSGQLFCQWTAGTALINGHPRAQIKAVATPVRAVGQSITALDGRREIGRNNVCSVRGEGMRARDRFRAGEFPGAGCRF